MAEAVTIMLVISFLAGVAGALYEWLRGPSQVPTDERIITYLTLTLCAVVLALVGGAIFVDDFRREGAAIAGVIGGILAAPLTTYIGARFTRELRSANGGAASGGAPPPQETPAQGEPRALEARASLAPRRP